MVEASLKDGLPSVFGNRKQRKNIPSKSKIISVGDSIFRSNFESGNIASVTKTSPATYEIALNK